MHFATIKIKDDWWRIRNESVVDNGKSTGCVEWDDKEILIGRYTRDDVEISHRDRVETLLHEILHVELPDHSEEAILRIGKSLTDGLLETRIMEEL